MRTRRTPHTLTRARAAQLAREEAVHNKTVALLAERVRELERLKSTLGAAEILHKTPNDHGRSLWTETLARAVPWFSLQQLVRLVFVLKAK